MRIYIFRVDPGGFAHIYRLGVSGPRRDTLIYQDCVYIHMKTKWTVSLDSDLSDAADMLVASRRFATRTHLVEVAVLKLLEVEGASKK